MSTLGKLHASLASATQETTVSLANLNFDFSLLKVEPPAEYRELGVTLSPRRRTAAESGSHHSTARKLASLFQSILPSTPKLVAAYGRRASDISSSNAVNPRGTAKHGAFQDFVGLDGTTIWAAATSGPAAIAVHLLACMLASMWPASEASAIWIELVSERLKEIRTVTESGYATLEDYAAAHLVIEKQQLYEWDASARAWLRAAQESPSVKSRQTKLMLILKNIEIPVSSRPDVYRSVLDAWKLSLETMENVLSGGSYSVQDGAVLVALSAWNLYPDLVILSREEQALIQRDELIPDGAQVTVGLGTKKPIGSDGVYWSLSLRHLRYYGAPVKTVRSIGSDLDRWEYSEFLLVIMGAILGHWHIGKAELEDGLDFICLLSSTTDRLSAKRSPVSRVSNCFRPFSQTANSYRDAKGSARDQKRKLLLLGWRHNEKIIDRSRANSQFGSAIETRLIVELEDQIKYLRSRVANLYPTTGDHFVIQYERNSFCSAVPLDKTGRHCRWTCSSDIGMNAEECVLPLDAKKIKTGSLEISGSTRFPTIFTWADPPPGLGGREHNSPTSGSRQKEGSAKVTAQTVDSSLETGGHRASSAANTQALTPRLTNSSVFNESLDSLEPEPEGPLPSESQQIFSVQDPPGDSEDLQLTASALPQFPPRPYDVTLGRTAMIHEEPPPLNPYYVRLLEDSKHENKCPVKVLEFHLVENCGDCALYRSETIRDNGTPPSTVELQAKPLDQQIEHDYDKEVIQSQGDTDRLIAENAYPVDHGSKPFAGPSLSGRRRKEMSFKRINHLLRTYTIDLSMLFEVCALLEMENTAHESAKPKGNLLDLLRFLTALQLVFEEIPGATISPRCIDARILESRLISSLLINQNQGQSAFSYADSHWRARKALSTDVHPLSLRQAFAALCMLESGSLDIDPEDLQRVFAISSGDSLYIAAPLLCDPGTEHPPYSIRRVIGNVGRPGITLMIPPASSEVRNADPEHWNLVNHNEFDGKLEDAFQSTSLHVRFTGFVLAVDVGLHGSQFREISFAEAVISVFDSGNWVADINVLESLESGSLVRIQQSRECELSRVESMPAFDSVAIENWDEILDPPTEPAVFKTHGNWQARLAAMCICISLQHCIILFQNHRCWSCAGKAAQEQGYSGAPNMVFIL
ncbi:uncharacterized protein CDV56_108611 [Aspergillus thermomutatus]|uniref:Uncharacterized protein n=1 Tax=Aspergillus thermomutatus TaxID=41047 RepID=A0A397HHZ0_ASPTH|nr:uncharacterized protein CDV56_108611 [Aspergillus thermomutatus]RHZ60823.1 hypothetical protein CDV56_108611 [Aspergillus thermomutatus]